MADRKNRIRVTRIRRDAYFMSEIGSFKHQSLKWPSLHNPQLQFTIGFAVKQIAGNFVQSRFRQERLNSMYAEA